MLEVLERETPAEIKDLLDTSDEPLKVVLG
jgi:hypothetical protein